MTRRWYTPVRRLALDASVLLHGGLPWRGGGVARSASGTWPLLPTSSRPMAGIWEPRRLESSRALKYNAEGTNKRRKSVPPRLGSSTFLAGSLADPCVHQASSAPAHASGLSSTRAHSASHSRCSPAACYRRTRLSCAYALSLAAAAARACTRALHAAGHPWPSFLTRAVRSYASSAQDFVFCRHPVRTMASIAVPRTSVPPLHLRSWLELWNTGT